MFTYKGITSEGRVRVLNVSRTLLPSSEVTTTDIEGNVGLYFVKKTHGVRVIRMDLAIIGDTPEDLMDRVEDVADWLDADKPEPLVLNDSPDRTFYAIVQGDTSLDEQLKYGFFTVEFICPDPYSYGAERTENLVSGVNSITYNGTAPTYPTMTITFPSAIPNIQIDNGEDIMELTYSFDTTTTLEINSQTGKITINGEINSQIMSLTSDFFPLKKGSNTINVSEGASIVMKYKERFK